MPNRLKSEKGFTLLELLVVIVVIGILALLVIPNLASAPKKARDVDRKTDLRGVQKAVEEYYISYSAYPVTTSWSALTTVLNSGTPPLMKNVPTETLSSSPAYYYNGTSSAYTLKACLENTSDSGQYVIADTTYCGTGGKAFTLNNLN